MDRPDQRRRLHEHRGQGRRARPSIYRRLRAIRDKYLGQIRTGYPKIPRRVSGYNLDYLLPEKHFHVARALVGSESTLVTVLTAEIKLVEIPSSARWWSSAIRTSRGRRRRPAVVRHQPLAARAWMTC